MEEWDGPHRRCPKMNLLSPRVLIGFGLLALLVGFAGLRYGLPTSGSLYLRPGSDTGLASLIFVGAGFVAIYGGVARIELSQDARRARRFLLFVVGLASVQAALTLAMLLLAALVIAGVLGHWVVDHLLLVAVPCLVQAIYSGIALRRLASGWPWVKPFRIAGFAAIVPFCYVLWIITSGALAPPSPEPQTWVELWAILATSYLLPLSLTLWLMTHRATDEWGVDVGTPS